MEISQIHEEATETEIISVSEAIASLVDKAFTSISRSPLINSVSGAVA